MVEAGVDDGSIIPDKSGEWVPRILQKGQPFTWLIQPRKLRRYVFGFPKYDTNGKLQ